MIPKQVMIVGGMLCAMLVAACAFEFNSPPPPPTTLPTPQPTPIPFEGHTPQPTLAPLGQAEKANWRLVFSDEFDGPHLDTRKWDTQYWTGRTAPPELEYYAPDAFEFGAGTLRLKAERRHMGQMSYTSGMISSYRKFDLTYGYVELRGKIPEGRGLWPAFWLLTYGEQPPFEIDVMEILGHEPQRIYTTMHYRDASGANHDDGNDYVGADFSADFHLFAVEWTPDVIIWYIDGVERYRVTEHVPQQPMYIIANLAIGGDWPGNPDATTRFPAYFEIDYIRAYQH